MFRKPLSIALLCALSVLSRPGLAINSSLTYQGSLEDAGQPADGTYDFLFEVQDSAGAIIGEVLGRDDVQVDGGVFTVSLDFGPSVFTGADRFLRVSVRPGASNGNYTALNPRSAVTPAPYAQVADDANFAASVANDSIGAPQIIDNSMTRFDIGSAAVGTDEISDNSVTAAELQAGSVSTVKLQDAAVTGDKLQDGSVTNIKIAAGSVTGDRIAPGGVNALAVADESLTSVDIGPNAVGLTEVKSSEVQLRVGAACPTGSAMQAIAATGAPTCASFADSSWSTAGNAVSGAFLGTLTTAPLTLRVNNKRVASFQHGTYGPSVILGSELNATAGGARGVVIAGGGTSTDPEFDLLGPNIVIDSYGAVGGGINNQAGDSAGGEQGALATVAGGHANVAEGGSSAIGGGRQNSAGGQYSAIPGGFLNKTRGTAATVGGGESNCAGASWSWVGGVAAKTRAGANAGGAATGACAGLTISADAEGDRGSFVWADATGPSFVTTSSNQFLVRVAGGMGLNTAPPDGNVELTMAADSDGTDYVNLWLKQKAASNNGMMISVGDGNGSNNAAFYLDHYNGTAQARRLSLNNDGSVLIRSNTTAGATGVLMAANAGSWSSLSDRNAKTAIMPVDPHQVLAGVAALPLSTWSYTAQGEHIRHMGPMAQDFAAAFGLGEDDTHISTVDIDGVALAAIQGLNAQLQQSRAEVAELKARLERLERAMAAQSR